MDCDHPQYILDILDDILDDLVITCNDGITWMFALSLDVWAG